MFVRVKDKKKHSERKRGDLGHKMSFLSTKFPHAFLYFPLPSILWPLQSSGFFPCGMHQDSRRALKGARGYPRSTESPSSLPCHTVIPLMHGSDDSPCLGLYGHAPHPSQWQYMLSRGNGQSGTELQWTSIGSVLLILNQPASSNTHCFVYPHATHDWVQLAQT